MRMDDHTEYEMGDTENVVLGIDHEGEKQWYLSTREGLVEVGENRVLTLTADLYTPGTTIELTNAWERE